MAWPDLEQTIEEYHLAPGKLVKGDAGPATAMYSHRDDVSLANPFGPVTVGWKSVTETAGLAAARYREGEVTGFEQVAKHVTGNLACIVEVERYKAKIGGKDNITPVGPRVTSLFRLEDGVWKLVHRHADPITSIQPTDSVIEK
jgi:ketosteroid isomerase-like protein